jgi:hypothetical protein
MKIETKYNIGETVFLLLTSKIYKTKVFGADIYINSELPTKVYYKLEDVENSEFKLSYIGINEDYLFRTKRDLINFLRDKLNNEN